MSEVECITLSGDKRLVPVDALTWRPAAHALVVHGGKVLLLKLKHNGKYLLPGGGIHIDEHIQDALK